MLSWMTQLSLELIGQAGLGYTFNDLTENAVEHPYQQASKQLMGSYSEYFYRFPVVRQIRQYGHPGQDAFLRSTIMPKMTKIGTPTFRKFIVDHTPLQLVQNMRRIVQVMHDTSVEIFESKKTMEWDEQRASDIGNGNDIITTLSKSVRI